MLQEQHLVSADIKLFMAMPQSNAATDRVSASSRAWCNNTHPVLSVITSGNNLDNDLSCSKALLVVNSMHPFMTML